MLSEIFGDFEDFVNVVGKDCGEVRPRVPGHVGAEGNVTGVWGILNIPDLWHAAPRPERQTASQLKCSSSSLVCNVCILLETQ